MKVCKKCGVEMQRRRGQQFCRHCIVERQKAQVDARRVAVGAILVGSAMCCGRCETNFIKEKGKQRFCAACRIDGTERRRRHERRYPEKTQARRKARDKRRRADPEYLKAERERLNNLTARRKTCPVVRLHHRMAETIRRSLKTSKAGRSWRSLVPYTLDQLRAHIERQFVPGMSWENMGAWHIDHIIPLSSFRITGCDDQEFAAAWGLTNLRPLWAKANLAKSSLRTLLI